MVEILFVPCEFEGEIVLNESALRTIKEKTKRVYILSSVQFNTKKIEEQLKKEGIVVEKVRVKRALKKGQILGCDCYKDSFSKKIFEDKKEILYVGDGLFHQKALLIAQKENFKKNIFSFNPITKEFAVLGKEKIEEIVKKVKRNIRFFLNARKIGIICSTKFGQQYLNLCIKIKKELQKKNKKAFVFVCDYLELKELENFPFIECWINSACPRIGYDEILTTEKPIVNIKDAFNAESILDN